MYKIITGVLTCIVLLAAVLLLFVWYQAKTIPAPSSTSFQSVQALQGQTVTDSPDFSAAIQAEGQGDYAAAITDLQTALAAGKDPAEVLTMMFHLSSDYVSTSDFTDAVQVLKSIASDQSNSSVARAIAVEDMGYLYANYTDPTVGATIFAAEPYSSLSVQGNTNLTTRKLFQYATTIAVLPISEYSIANSYANSILSLGSSTTTAKLAQLQKGLDSSFQAGDTALQTVEQNPPTTSYVLNAELIRATVLGKMQQIGDTSASTSAETAFTDLLNSYASQKQTEDGTVRLQYAIFLANVYGASQSADIQSILAPIYQDPSAHAFFLTPYLKQYIGASALRAKNNIVLVASMDPNFKSYLESLGWTSADLATSTGAGN